MIGSEIVFTKGDKPLRTYESDSAVINAQLARFITTEAARNLAP